MKSASLDYLKTRIAVDVERGVVTWLNATKHHTNLVGKEAGAPRNGGKSGPTRKAKKYWHIKIDGDPIKRAHIVFLFATGRWPEIIDHINGDSMDDRIENLREATVTQNAWNHKSRSKNSSLPMGVRETDNGRFQARIQCNKKTIHLGTFMTSEQASSVYQEARKEFFGDYA